MPRLPRAGFWINNSTSVSVSSPEPACLYVPLRGTDRGNPLRQGRYADPLVPRKTSDAQFWPKDVTPEMEQKWLAMIKEQHSA